MNAASVLVYVVVHIIFAPIYMVSDFCLYGLDIFGSEFCPIMISGVCVGYGVQLVSCGIFWVLVFRNRHRVDDNILDND